MIKQNRLSLTKKLDGGYLHVHKRQHKSITNRGGYSSYLEKNRGGATQVNKNSSKQSGNKVVAIKLRPSSKKKPSSNRRKKAVKSIPNIMPKKEPMPPSEKPAEKPVKPQAAEKQAAEKQAAEKQAAKHTGVTIQNPKVKGSLKKQRVLKNVTGKSKSRRINKSLTRRRNNSLKKGKRISVTKLRKYSDKDISRIQSRLKDINKRSNEQIKQELNKQGIQLSGKSPEILKDIYMYSQLCGINIKRE
jgi:hypothetical protein